MSGLGAALRLMAVMTRPTLSSQDRMPAILFSMARMVIPVIFFSTARMVMPAMMRPPPRLDRRPGGRMVTRACTRNASTSSRHRRLRVKFY